MWTTLALVLSLLFILHAAYSAYEYVSFSKRLKGTDPAIPLDIVLELIVSAAIFCVASVFAADPLKVVIRHEWAATQAPPAYRNGFLDIVKLRRDYRVQDAAK